MAVNDPQTFEYELWRLLNGHNISRPVQTRLGNQILALARKHFGVTDAEYQGDPAGGYAKGTSIHYFRNAAAERSACGRMYRRRLQTSRITYNPLKSTCSHCRHAAGINTGIPGDSPTGGASHWFRNELAERSVCSRVKREGLAPERIVLTQTDATCRLCANFTGAREDHAYPQEVGV